MSEDKSKYNKEGIIIKYFGEEIRMHPFSEVESINEDVHIIYYKNGYAVFFVGKPVKIGKTADYVGIFNYEYVGVDHSPSIGVITMSEDELYNFTAVCDGAVAGEDVDCPSDTGPARVVIDYNGEGLEMVCKDVCNPDISDGAMSKGNVYVFGMTFTPRDIVLQGSDDYYGECRGVLLCLSKEDALAYADIRSERIAKEKEDEAKEIQARIADLMESISMPMNSLLVLENEGDGAHKVLKAYVDSTSSYIWEEDFPISAKKVLVHKFTQASMYVMGVGTVYIVPLEDVAAYLKK